MPNKAASLLGIGTPHYWAQAHLLFGHRQASLLGIGTPPCWAQARLLIGHIGTALLGFGALGFRACGLGPQGLGRLRAVGFQTCVLWALGVGDWALGV